MAASYISTQTIVRLDPAGLTFRTNWSVNAKTKTVKGKTYKLKSEIDHISVRWYEWIPVQQSDGTVSIQKRLIETHSSVSKSATKDDYTASSNAVKVGAAIKLILTSTGKKYWTTQYTDIDKSNHQFNIKGSVLTTPDAPTVTFQNNNTTLRITTSTNDVLAKKCQFRVLFEPSGTTSFINSDGDTIIDDSPEEQILGYIPSESGYLDLTRTSSSGPGTATATYPISASSGGVYKVQVMYIADFATGSYGMSEWSGYGYAGGGSGTDPVVRPGRVYGVSASMVSSTEIYVHWTPVTVAYGTVTYNVEYAENQSHFGSSLAQTDSGLQQPNDSISVTAGKTYYIRVRAVVGSQEGEWSSVASVSVALQPDKPSAWTLDTNVKESDTLTFYWLHRGKDSAKPTQWQLEYWIQGRQSATKVTRSGSYNLGPDDTDYTKSYDISVMPFAHDGEVIEWHVRTMGISSAGWSEWSATAYVNVFGNPEVGISGLEDPLTEYPYTIRFMAMPSSQTALSFSISIFATDTYESVDYLGNNIIINAGDEIYHQIFLNVGNNFQLDLKPNMLTLESSHTYRLHVIVYMSSGLSAEAEGFFDVLLDETSFEIDAGFIYDTKTLAAAIYPRATIYSDEDEEYEEVLVDNTLMSVYRINRDGTFTEIARDLTNDGSSVVIDPHPALRNAQYRVVATNMLTGNIYYSDYIAEKDDFYFPSIVMQWDGIYRDLGYFEESDTDLIFGRLYTGKTLILPGNTKISESSNKDVILAEYIGREHPVSYFGTQKGSQANWYAEFPKKDFEAIDLVRKLDAWSGNVYVREPYGSGYWATVAVSYNIDYDNLVVPVSFQIKRIESKEP